MIITIDKEYFIKTDPFQYILKKNVRMKDQKTGKEKDGVVTEGYYPKVEDALRGYIKAKTNDDDSTVSVKEYIEKIKEMLNFEFITIKKNKQ